MNSVIVGGIITVIGITISSILTFFAGRRQSAATVQAAVQSKRIEGETQIKVAQVSAESQFTQSLYQMIEVLTKRMDTAEAESRADKEKYFAAAAARLELVTQVAALRADVDRLHAESKRKQQEYEAEVTALHNENIDLKSRVLQLEIELKNEKDARRQSATGGLP